MTKNKKMYFVYHIPKVKVGMTHDLGARVFDKQGYDPSDVQILYATRSMEEASELEIAYQKSLGYAVDRMSYKDLMGSKKAKKADNSFKINVTDMTTTFPVWKFDVKKYLNKNLDKVITLNTGETIMVTPEVVDWIDSNSIDSQYTKGRTFVYNKALLKFMRNPKNPNDLDVVYDLVNNEEGIPYENVYDLIRLWAKDKGIYDKGDSKTQYVKLMEEAGELARALLKKDAPEIKDAIGDIVVVLTNLAALERLNIEDCVTSAYDVIKSRQGNMINGSFVKNETL
tara:strand:+ start:347 stop:1198 length:852 start_codon:yes stop_codon:yes gene_type:complete